MISVDLNKKKHKESGKLRKFFKVFFVFVLSFISIFSVDYFFFTGSDLFSQKTLFKAVTDGSKIFAKVFNTELKNENLVTSALIVGIDTRNVIYKDGEFKSTNPKGQAGTRNTDTLIQAVYDHQDKSLTFISIPRDLGVDYDEECLKFSGSIHWIYDKTQSKSCPGGGVSGLIQTVESVTGIKIQYYAFVTLDGFIEAVETLGETNPETGEKGIYVENPTDVWELYPKDDYGWENVYFKKGRIFLTGERALKYVRSRQMTTDFGRAARQQILIEALVKNILSSDTLSNPEKLTDLYKIYKERTLISEISLKELVAGVEVLDTFQLDNDINIILDPELGGNEAYLNKQPHDRSGGPYYMVPTHWKECGKGNEFCRIHSLIQSIKQNPEVYSENAKTFAYATNYTEGKLDFSNPIFDDFAKSDPPVFLNKSSYKANTGEDLAALGSVVVLDFSKDTKPETKNYFMSKGFTVVDGESYVKYRLNQEDFSILVF